MLKGQHKSPGASSSSLHMKRTTKVISSFQEGRKSPTFYQAKSPARSPVKSPVSNPADLKKKRVSPVP